MSKPVILCVDDEPVVLNSLKIQLKKAFQDAYIYESAESAEEALEILTELQDEAVPIVVIVSDWLMPGTKGDDFLVEVHQIFPNIVKIMLTGQADASAIERAKAEANLYECIGKPWDSQELIAKIRAGLAEAQIDD